MTGNFFYYRKLSCKEKKIIWSEEKRKIDWNMRFFFCSNNNSISKSNELFFLSTFSSSFYEVLFTVVFVVIVLDVGVVEVGGKI